MLRRYRDGAVSDGALDCELAAIRRVRELARQQLITAERAQAGIDVTTRLALIRNGLEAPGSPRRPRSSDGSWSARWSRPGAAVLRGAGCSCRCS